MATIAVDMDEVVADALGEHLRIYNELVGASMERHHFVGVNFYHAIPAEHLAIAESIVHTEEFFANLEVMEGAQEVLEKLSRNHEVFITTAAMEVPKSFNAKYEWLRKHFPFISTMNYVFCGAKHIIAADYLIDDNARHFKRFKGEGILFDAPHNRNVQGYQRVLNWKEVDELFSNKRAMSFAN